MSIPSIQAVVFDLDDTLCGYWGAAKQGLRTAFTAHGLDPESMMNLWGEAFREFAPTLKRDGWYERYCVSGTLTRTELMRRTLLLAGKDDPDLATALSQTYREARNAALELFPESIEVLDAIQRPMGLITNGPADIQREEIATLGIERYFDPILIEGEVGIGKPEYEPFRRAEEAFGFPASEILFVGNSYKHDIAPAIEYGWKTAWIRRPSDVAPSAHGPEEMPEGAIPPDLVITDLRELLTLVPSLL